MTDTRNDEKRHAELLNLLQEARDAYHRHGDSTLSDDQYDALSSELLELESRNPSLASDIGTAVGADESGLGGTMRRHPSPVQSLENAFSERDLVAFGERLSRKLGGIDASSLPFTVEYKLDGLSANIVYVDGKLDRAETRGDGSQGEDITAQMRMIGIPESIGEGLLGTVEVRGEIYMARSTLEEHNAKVAKGEITHIRSFANCRNAAVGCLRKGTPERVAMLRFAVWGAGLTEGLQVENQSNFLGWAEGIGFQIAPRTMLAAGLDHAARSHQLLEEQRAAQDFDADGSVIKLDDFKLQVEAGRNSKAPAWAIAWKFKAEQVTTPLRNVTFTTGSQGKINPVAELEPVKVEGSIISRATLNNEDYMLQLDLHEGDTVIIQKAGGVIPQIVGVVAELRKPGAKRIEMPAQCPACGSPTVREAGQAGTFCTDPDCPAQVEAKLLQAVGADVLDIQGLGPSVISALCAAGMKNFKELYKLHAAEIAVPAHRLALLQVNAGTDEEGQTKTRPLGQATADKILSEIQKSRTTDLWRFIRAMNIPMTGKGTSTRLARTYQSLAELRDAAVAPDGEERIAEIRDIGSLTAAAICSFFRKHPDLPEELEAMGVRPKPSEQLQEGGALSGMSIVVTGTMSKGRADVENWLRRHGADITGSVTKNTTHLLAGPGGGSKLQKAQSLGTTVLSEEEMRELCQRKGIAWLGAAPVASGGENKTGDAAGAGAMSDLSDLRVALTGTLSVDRGTASDWLARHGATVMKELNSKATHLLAGAKAGSKAAKAASLGIVVMDEQAIKELCASRGMEWLS